MRWRRLREGGEDDMVMAPEAAFGVGEKGCCGYSVDC